VHPAHVVDAELMREESGPRTSGSHIGSALSDLMLVERQAAAIEFDSGLKLVLCKVSTIEWLSH
jgi:hypothetical protein